MNWAMARCESTKVAKAAHMSQLSRYWCTKDLISAMTSEKVWAKLDKECRNSYIPSYRATKRRYLQDGLRTGTWEYTSDKSSDSAHSLTCICVLIDSAILVLYQGTSK